MEIQNKKSLVLMVAALLIIVLAGVFLKNKPVVPGATTPSPTISTALFNPPLSDNEGDVLNVPGPSASEAEKTRFAALVAKFAKNTNTLTITRCTPSPLVVRIANGNMLTIKNADSNQMRMILEKKVFDVAGSKSFTLTAGFGKGEGIFGYQCISGSGQAGRGLILVTK